jgi:hypothetical protein
MSKKDEKATAVPETIRYHVGVNLFSNSAVIVASSISSPRTETLVDLAASKSVPRGATAPGHAIARVSPTFKMVLWIVVAITLLGGFFEIVLAGVWPTPTPNQQVAFEAMDWAWKSGIGAILGLLGGIQLSA